MHMPQTKKYLVICQQRKATMAKQNNHLRSPAQLLLLASIGLSSLFVIRPAKSFIPYVYEPNRETLKKYYDEILYMYSDAAALAGHRRFEHDHFWVDQ